MLDQAPRDFVALPAETPPLLLVVVDTEEEFDWSKPLARENRAVASIAEQPRAQEIFAEFGIVPTYVIDHPVAEDHAAASLLRGLADEGACEIGAHLHPWVNPPHDETVTPRNSYPGNLPADLERAKLEVLTALIEANLGRRPTIYKAGRYGLGPNTAATLEALGYRIDVSVVPHTSFAADGGPDFTAFDPRPYWHGEGRRLLEVPLTCAFYGLLRAWGRALYPALAGGLGMSLHLPGIFARSGLLERIRLTPEGVGFAEQRRLTQSLHAQGCRLFSYSYHSPSLAAGNTPYVRDAGELKAFLQRMRDYFAYFVGELGGRPLAVSALYDMITDSGR